jgi:hypothetical protein
MPNTEITWTGDLLDDCTAYFHGLLLRAEDMDGETWWWAVTQIETGVEIESSNDSSTLIPDGVSAREAAEKCARKYLSSFMPK